MTAFDWIITITPVLPVAIIAAGVLYAVGKKRLQDRTWKLATREGNSQFKGYRDTINKLIRDCQDIRDDFRARTDELDGLVAEYRGQRDAAQAGVVAAHIERDAAQVNWATVIAERNELNMANRMLSDNCQRLSSDNARLIEENGRLIAELSGSIKYTALAPMWSAAHALKAAITEAERTIPLKADVAVDGLDYEPDTDDDDDKPSGEVVAAHREFDNGEHDES